MYCLEIYQLIFIQEGEVIRLNSPWMVGPPLERMRDTAGKLFW
jgi:hypothetical protein